MNRERNIVLQLLAQGRVDTAQAERLIAALSAERESLWAMAGCAAIVAIAQVHSLAPGLLHMVREVIVSSLPALHHIVNSFGLFVSGSSFGGLL